MKALIFDFDGTIIDTEESELNSWQFIFEQYGQTLPLDQWHNRVGTNDWSYNPLLHLESLAGIKLNHANIIREREAKKTELLTQLKPLPGVLDWITTSKKLGLQLAIASNSSQNWVKGHLESLELLNYFDLIIAREHITHLKPNPEIYQLVLTKLNIVPDEAIAIEDSHHGVSAALAAGIRCIAVPNKILTHINFPQTFARTTSLADLSPHHFLKKR